MQVSKLGEHTQQRYVQQVTDQPIQYAFAEGLNQNKKLGNLAKVQQK
jgi:hypothetical protein